MKKPTQLALALALLCAIICAVVFLRPASLQSSARRNWKDKSIAEITARVADPEWLTNELAKFRLQGAPDETDDGTWLSDHLIVTRNGEWLAYANVCQKKDRRIQDLFLARGSDGHWYYSTYHFCVGMVVLRMEEQPEDLVTFVKAYSLGTFDGQSDDCLQRTWPPTFK